MFDAGRLAALVDAIEARMKAGSDVVIVSSGAIAAGIEPLGLTRRPTDLATKQAAASVGQVALVQRVEHGRSPATTAPSARCC